MGRRVQKVPISLLKFSPCGVFVSDALIIAYSDVYVDNYIYYDFLASFD